MAFDARAAKLLAPWEHYTMPNCPGLRFEVSSTARPWIYRYKSPVGGKMHQVKIGAWPAVPVYLESLGLDEKEIFNVYNEIPSICDKDHVLIPFIEVINDPTFHTGTGRLFHAPAHREPQAIG